VASGPAVMWCHQSMVNSLSLFSFVIISLQTHASSIEYPAINIETIEGGVVPFANIQSQGIHRAHLPPLFLANGHCPSLPKSNEMSVREAKEGSERKEDSLLCKFLLVWM
jgi:hypothetical protein